VNCFVDKSTGAIYKGNRYNQDGKVSVFTKSPQRLARIRRTIEQGVSLSFGAGKKILYIFTDPECPYCRKFEKQAKGLLDDYTVKVIFYPLRFHKSAPAMTEWILQGKDDNERHARMEEIMIKHSQAYKSLTAENKTFRYTPKIQKILQKGQSAVRLLHVRGTPTIYSETFTKINWGALLSRERSKKRLKK